MLYLSRSSLTWKKKTLGCPVEDSYIETCLPPSCPPQCLRLAEGGGRFLALCHLLQNRDVLLGPFYPRCLLTAGRFSDRLALLLSGIQCLALLLSGTEEERTRLSGTLETCRDKTSSPGQVAQKVAKNRTPDVSAPLSTEGGLSILTL